MTPKYWLVDPSHRAVEVLIPGEEGFALHHVYQGAEYWAHPYSRD